MKVESVWAPQSGFQSNLVSCPVRDIFAGGARGGGKTDGICGRVLMRATWFGKHYNGAVFRQEMPQADDLIERALEVWGEFGRYQKVNRVFTFNNGARARFRPLQSVRDASKYQGQNLTDAIVEEAGNYPDPSPIDRLYGALRSARGVPTSLLLSGNPGGPGQPWLKQRYIAPWKDGMRPIRVKIPAKPGIHGELEHLRIFIPGKVTDNRILLRSDPNYIANLYQVGDKKLVDAWLSGDWDAVEGAFFEDLSEWRHIIEPFEIPEHWLRFRSIDWGYAAPFSVGWWAVVGDAGEYGGVELPRGAMIRYREWYGRDPKHANTGIRKNADEVARGILERTGQEKIAYTVMDPAAWGTQSGPSIAETMLREGIACRRADNKRVAGRGSMGGWDQVRQRLRGAENGPAMLYAFKTCRSWRRLMPQMQHDRDKPEDLDTDMEDHIADETRYACMSRPWTKGAPPPPSRWREPSLDELIEMHERRSEDY